MSRLGIGNLSFVVAALVLTTAAFADDPNTVVQNERAFHPGEITIVHGTTLNVKNQDEFIHQIYVDSPNFDYDSEEQAPGETLHIAFPQAGTFPVRCHIHPKMLLIVHVK
ncbi:MAG TPA: cupredoxin domain-containing protein [Rhizomicrobium sp.]|nr:cupredoxin domain-containing protein [Rhizomicrobium sp.]